MHSGTEQKSVGFLRMEHRRTDVSPVYQREGGIWSTEKKQLFIDSLINGYDIPKIYVHDFRTEKKEYQFAVIDGKQRLTTLWSFLDNDFPLAKDFEYRGDYQAPSSEPPKAGMQFSDFSEEWRTYVSDLTLDIVFVKTSDPDDIEDLFARLNNGEKLNAAESRNAMGGRGAELIREVAKHKFFAQRIPFANKRFAHYEVAAKFLLMSDKMPKSDVTVPDLKKRHLDAWVNANRQMSETEYQAALKKVNSRLNQLHRVFVNDSPHLAKQSYPQMAYLFVERIVDRYGHSQLERKIREFFDDFLEARTVNLGLDEDERDSTLIEFGRLSQQGTNDSSSMESRYEYMTRYFLEWNQDVAVKDDKRFFTAEERYIIWKNGGKKCASCGIALDQWSDVSADHKYAWIKGGQTALSNAQALCAPCNSKKRDS